MNGPVLILGGGPAGLSLALFLKDLGARSTVLEKSGRAGGLAGSFRIGPYTFDHSGHILHTSDPAVLDLVKQRLGVALDRIERKSVCLVDGRWIPYPYQQNLFGMSDDRVREALTEFYGRRIRRPKNFREWIHASCGDGVGRQFMYPYNAKLWNVDLRKMAVDWIPRFIPSSGAKEILKSAFTEQVDPWGYNAVFYYPKSGGMGAIANRLASTVADRTVLNAGIREIDIRRREVRTDNGVIRYGHLVSTIPLPDFLRLCGERIPDVCRSTAVSVFNIGVRQTIPHEFHWCYVPDRSVPFYRFGIYSNISKRAAPAGHSSLYVECAAKPDGLSRFTFKDVAAHLKRLGVIRRVRDIDTVHRIDIRRAYPVPLIGLKAWRGKLVRRLQRHGIDLIGRFGAWRYVAISDVISEAKALAEKLAR